jgi:inosine-uridine nucleoside N-ribohydrolase
MLAIAPHLYTSKAVFVAVELAGTLTRGELVPDWSGHWGKKEESQKSNVVMHCDAAACKRLLLNRIKLLHERRGE